MWPFKKAQLPFSKKAVGLLTSMGLGRFTSWNYRAYANEGYSQNPVVFACVNKIATAASSTDIYVYKRSRGGAIKKLDDHPLEKLIAKPNPLQSGRQFLNDLISFRGIGGEYFILGVGAKDRREVKELQLLDPGCMTVVKGRGIFPARYEYKVGAETIVYEVDQISGRSEILHGKTFNPTDPWRGMAPMAAAAFGVDIVNEGQKWNKKLLDNECRPPGALMVEGGDGKSTTLSEEQFTRLNQQIVEQFSGANNAGKPLLLEGGVKWQALGMNPRDMDFKENIWAAARFICSVYGVPPQLVGIPGESTYSNYEQAELSLWANTVLPLLGTILDDLNRWFAPIYGDDIYLWFDEEMITALELLRKQKAERINAAEYMTIDEKREAMGLEAYKPSKSPGGVLLVQSSDIPLELVGDLGLAEPGSESDKPEDDEDEAD